VSEGIAWALHIFGNIEQDLGAYEKAIPYYEQSLSIFNEIGEQGSYAETLNALGTAFLALKQREKAQQTYRRALQLAAKIQAMPVAMYALSGYAATLGNSSEAAKLLSFVLQHPASDQETKDTAGGYLMKLEVRLSANEMILAQEASELMQMSGVLVEVLGR